MVVLGDGAVSCQRGTPVGCRVRIGVGTRIRQLRHPGTLRASYRGHDAYGANPSHEVMKANRIKPFEKGLYDNENVHTRHTNPFNTD